MADIHRRGKLAEAEGDWGAALRAAELEGKHLGAFEAHQSAKAPVILGRIELVPLAGK